MKKTFYAFALCALFCLSVMFFAGCSATEKEINCVTDIFTDMQPQTDKIEVRFDNNTGKPFKFTVENKDDIHSIMDTVLNEKLVFLGSFPPPPGDNTSITIFQGENAYLLSVNIICFKENNYAFSTNSLEEKIRELAVAAGAYENIPDRTDATTPPL